jgi:anaerobic magnesium-protoporphyrin IX monomethyl ester cyclase
VKVALVHPPPRSEFDRHWARFPVLGLAYVAASLLHDDHEVVLLDGKLAGLSVADIVRRIRAEAPDLVGITCMTVEFPVAVAIARAIKAEMPVPIVIGGAPVNAAGRDVLAECKAFDFACVGEGEHLVGELIAAITGGGRLQDIPGLVFRRHGLVVGNAARTYPRDYDQLPFPAWHLFHVGDQIPLLTHRGCPFQCNFCGHNSGFRPRYRSVDNVLAEIDELIARYRPAVVRFEDETFGLQVGRTKALLQGILARGHHRRVRFSAQTRVDRVDDELVGLLRAASFETLELGVESGNPRVLAATGKGITLEQVERAVCIARRHGLRVWCKFILGHPHETAEDMRDTIDFIARINPDRLSVAVMTPFPGTPIHDMARRGEGGYRLLARGWQDFDKYSAGALELDTVSLGQLKRFQLQAYANLYLRNGRVGELLRLVWDHRALAREMAWSTTSRTARELLAGARGVAW